jgi:hypothetical protein
MRSFFGLMRGLLARPSGEIYVERPVRFVFENGRSTPAQAGHMMPVNPAHTVRGPQRTGQ